MHYTEAALVDILKHHIILLEFSVGFTTTAADGRGIVVIDVGVVGNDHRTVHIHTAAVGIIVTCDAVINIHGKDASVGDMDSTAAVHLFGIVVIVILQGGIGQVDTANIRHRNQRGIGKTIERTVTRIARRIKLGVVYTVKRCRGLSIHTVHHDAFHIQGTGNINQGTHIRFVVGIVNNGSICRRQLVAAWVTVDLHVVLELRTIPSGDLVDGQLVHHNDVVARHITQAVENEVDRLGRLVGELGTVFIVEVLAIDAIHIEVTTRTHTINLNGDSEGG